MDHQLAGGVDPVWSPDGQIYTHPGMDGEGMNFHLAQDAVIGAMSGNPGASVPMKDPRLQGVYQSIGVKDDTYSVVTDEGGVSISRYTLGDNGVTPVGDVKKLCTNIPNFPTDLPMLSKDSGFISVYDQSSRSTKIFSIKDTNCELAVDLGFPTGKVSFNSDSSQIAFHLDQFGEFDDGWFSGISKDKVKNVVVMKLNREGNRLSPGDWALASNAVTPGDGGYYPDFDRAGNIHFMEDRDNFFQFVKVKPTQLEWFPYEQELFRTSGDCTNCVTSTSPKSGLEILSSLWTRVCESAGIDLTRSPLHATAIDPVLCREMVEDFWSESLGVSKESLSSACPRGETHTGRIVGEWNLNRSLEAEQIVTARCISCHTRPMEFQKTITPTVFTAPGEYGPGTPFQVRSVMPKIDLADSSSKTLGRMRESVRTGTMPMGSSFSVEESSMVQEFISRKMVDYGDPQDFAWAPEIYRYGPEALAAELDKALVGYESASEEARAYIGRRVNCEFGNIGCPAYLAEYERKLEGWPEADRRRALVLKKCEVLTLITPQECSDFFEKE